MTTFSVTKTTAENVIELLAESEAISKLVHSGESLMLYTSQALDGTTKLIINSAVGENLIIDFN